MSETLTAAEWLAKWDDGGVVPSIEMGGLSPAYEQAIQMQAAEVLREMLAFEFDAELWDDPDTWKADRNSIDNQIRSRNGLVEGLSGAQWCAALNLACCIYRRGTAVFDNDEVRDRKLLVSNAWPKLQSDAEVSHE